METWAALIGEPLVKTSKTTILTLSQVADAFERVTGTTGRRTHLPVWLLRVIGAVAGPFNPVLARQVRAGVRMATLPTPADPARTQQRYPVESITLEQWIRRRYSPPVGTSASPERTM